jgi:cytochrome c-type protein NapB
MRTILVFVFLAMFAVASLILVESLVAQGGSIAADELGLSKTSVFGTPAPDATAVNISDPGDRPTTPTDFPQQPPVIPHGILDFLPITLDDNACVDCHLVEVKEEGEPTPIPESHFVDFRNNPGSVGEPLVGARYNCVSCHVSPGGNAPLVENTFGD